MLAKELTFLPVDLIKPRPELQRGREVQVEPPLTLAVAGSAALRRGHSAAASAVVVAPLVAAEGLAGGESLMADGALVGLNTGRGGGGGGSRRVVGSSVGGAVRGGGGGLAVAGFVAAEGLVRREGLVADAALVGELQSRRRRRREARGGRRSGGGCGGAAGAAAGEHDEAESEVFFLGRYRRVLVKATAGRWAAGALPLDPWLVEAVETLRLLVVVVERERRRRCGRVQSF